MEGENNDYVVLDGHDIRGYNEAGVNPQTAEMIKKIQDWLKPTDYRADGSEYKKHTDSYVAGTGEWIWQSDAYQRWYGTAATSDDGVDSENNNNHGGALWIRGLPGTGKSVWAAVTADKIAQAEPTVPVLFFFFRQIIDANHTPIALVRDWLAQLLDYTPVLQAKLAEYVTGRKKIEEVGIDQLWNDLCIALELLPKVYCVADALDEMDDGNEEFLQRLVELGQRKPTTIKVVMTSRPIPHIEAILKAPSVIQLRLDQTQIGSDVSTFVQCKLLGIKDQVGDETYQVLKDSICQNAQGLFLHARLAVDGILEKVQAQSKLDVQSLEDTAKSIPSGLKELYTQMLAEHSTRSGVPQELQLLILQWVINSVRPLRLLELAELLNFTRAATGSITGSIKDDKETVRASCGRLLEVLRDETVSIIHHSFTEFLRDDARVNSVDSFPVINARDAHKAIAISCMRYVLSRCAPVYKAFQDKNKNKPKYSYSDDGLLPKMRQDHPLTDYATRHWYVHIEKAMPDDPDILDVLDSFLQPGTPVLDWRSIHFNDPHLSHVVTKLAGIGEDLSALHIDAFCGFTQHVDRLLKTKNVADVNKKDSCDRTPLLYAAERGHVEITEMLLDQGADPLIADESGYMPIHKAALNDRYDIIRLLLSRGVEPDVRTTKDPMQLGSTAGTENAIQFASRRGHLNTVRELMKYFKQAHTDEALLWASRNGQTEVVLMVLENEAQVDGDTHRRKLRNTAVLYTAVMAKVPRMIEVLLQQGGDPNIRLKDIDNSVAQCKMPTGMTAMHSFASGSTENAKECLDLLLKAGGKVELVDDWGWTPLHHACKHAPDETLIRCLLEGGANASAMTKAGEQPLHFLYWGKEAVIKLLVENGADINAGRPRDLRTALHQAQENNDSRTTKSLIACGVDCNAADFDGRTPLHLVMKAAQPNTDSIEALLNAGADPNRKDKRGQTPLMMYTHLLYYDFQRYLQQILDAGADLNAQDVDGNTMLFGLLEHNTYQVKEIQQLLQLGLSAKLKNRDGKDILHAHASNSTISMPLVKVFVEAGADPLCVDSEGNTLLHAAAKARQRTWHSSREEAFKYFVEMGVSRTARNSAGQTAFHFAAGTDGKLADSESRWDALSFFLDTMATGDGDIETIDRQGVRPIHYAAAAAPENVVRLVRAGADPTAMTNEGLSPLHIAARMRQPSTVGLLVSIYNERGDKNIINRQDKEGRTALHYACRSGRPESVRYLIDGGAGLKIVDDVGRTPLHAMAEFPLENSVWRQQPPESVHKQSWGVLLSDLHRPYTSLQDTQYREGEKIELDMHKSVRCTESIRLLLAKGASITAKDKEGLTPIDLAVQNQCEEMVCELQKHGDSSKDLFGQEYLGLSRIHGPGVLAAQMKNMNQNQKRKLLGQIIHTRDEELFAEFLRNGDVDPLHIKAVKKHEKGDRYKVSLLHSLTAWGYSSLLQVCAAHLRETNTTPNWNTESAGGQWQINPLLHLAQESPIPSVDTYRVLVEQLRVPADTHQVPEKNPNAIQPVNASPPVGDKTVLHVLACGHRWTDLEALEFLLGTGADVEAIDSEGRTPLHVAVNQNGKTSGFWSADAAAILLQHGANVNALDRNGHSCISKASPAMMRLLLKHGASITLGTKPALFGALDSVDADLVQNLLDAVPDAAAALNTPVEMANNTYWRLNDIDLGDRRDKLQQYYPLHYLAAAAFAHPERQTQAAEVATLMLERGADPLAIYASGQSILHCLAEENSLDDPLWDVAVLNSERKGLCGRTILLAACQGCMNSQVSGLSTIDDFLDTPTALLDSGADVTAVDDKGRNALHYLLSKGEKAEGKWKALVARILAQAPQLVNQADHSGLTPLHYAARLFSVQLATQFIAAGADPLLPGENGDTILHNFALFFSHASQLPGLDDLLTTILAKSPSSINARNNAGETPISRYISMVNTRSCSIDNIKFFVDSGAQLDVRNNAGETLLHQLAKRDTPAPSYFDKKPFQDMFRYLMDQGLDAFAEDNQHRTAVDVAAATGGQAILDMFTPEEGKK